MGRTARPQPRLPDAVGADLARRFAGPRPFPPPPAPADPRMARGRGLRPVRLPERQAPAGRRHQSQQRAPRRRPGGLGRLLDGPALCRPGADDRRAARDRCPSCSTSCACTGSRPPACRTTSPPRACWPRSASTRKAWRGSICGSTASGPTTCCSPCCAPTTTPCSGERAADARSDARPPSPTPSPSTPRTRPRRARASCW